MPVQSKPVLTPFGAALAGALGGCFSTAIVYPLDVAKTRIQALPKSKERDDTSMFSLLMKILKKEGIAGWYRGFGATMINTFSMPWDLYQQLRNYSLALSLELLHKSLLSQFPSSLHGNKSVDLKAKEGRCREGRAEDSDDNSFWAVGKEIIEEEGVTGLWLGLKPGLVLTVNPAITYGVYERVKSLTLMAKTSTGSDASMSPGLSFVVGALSKTLATVVTYPYIMAKVRIQARNADIDDAREHNLPTPAAHKPHHLKSKHPSAVGVLMGVLKREGFTGWYQASGMQAQIIKAVLSQALLFMSKEQFEKWAIAIILFIARLRSRIDILAPFELYISPVWNMEIEESGTHGPGDRWTADELGPDAGKLVARRNSTLDSRQSAEFCVLQVSSTAGRGAVRVTRRRLATEASPSAPKKKPRIVRRIFWATATLTGTFYVGSAFVALKNQTYYDFFADNVPLGQPMLEFAESHGWDTVTVKSAFDSTVNAATAAQKFVMEKVNGVPHTKEELENVKAKAEKKAKELKGVAVKTIEDSKERAKDVADRVKTQVTKEEERVSSVVKHQSEQLTSEVSALVQKAEDALAGKPASESAVLPSEPSPAPEGQTPSSDEPKSNDVYTAPLPVGFEAPPGFKQPPPPKREAPKTPDLPLIAPAVSSLGTSEPIISHLAGTIDSLASYLKSNPAAAERVSSVLEGAKGDLTALAERIEKAREEERSTLEAKLDEQTREYTIKLLEAEMESQDKLDNQEDEFRKMFDLRQAQLIQQYREKLENELQTQSELINERLKKEVVAQGIELQRRWIREIKMRVEEERGGRLAKIDELSAHLKRIERVALDNSAYLDENIPPVRKPFREELRVVRHIAVAREDPVVATALETLEASDVPDVGVEPFADLASWYTTSVAPKVSRVALVPDQDAGLLSHLASYLFSGLTFQEARFSGRQ
ncbi:MICOS complex subunit mic60 [Paramarasmius palmivorus]|uniref:MICOS complex subunit MIC60 n=1 Tax=Paramarasmius palmivorus TaxID=297713 RepID=A0AAW0C1U9_9AGAR